MHRIVAVPVPVCLSIEGRIATIADVFDALTSRRPYKEPFSEEKSLVIIRRWRESYFDPDVVDAFIAITEEILTIRAQYNQNNSQAFDIPELKVLLQQYTGEKLHEELLEIGHSPVLSHRGTHLF